ncbi:hypothetical protein [uncultured Sulfitobacter sp.]|uniref:hypothetical protein n=1 Tax=uncultured Sulfitobacter sp. TaxID=191468 RepID=UPI002594F857|nr:hypothetical protein [uncultured Sulfitobacter sp.]
MLEDFKKAPFVEPNGGPRWNSAALRDAHIFLDNEILKHHEESDAYTVISKARIAVEFADDEVGPR